MRVSRRVISVLTVLLTVMMASCGPDSGSGRLREADREYAAGGYSRAERLYQEYIEDNPGGSERWRAWNRMVDIALGVQRNQEKAAALLEAMQLEYDADPERNTDILKRLAGIYEAMNRRERALETWSKVLSLVGPGSPEAAEVYLEMGEIHQQSGDYSLARETMRECLEAAESPELEARCMYGMARYLSLLRNDVQAQVWLEKLTAMEDVDLELRAQAVYMLAGIYAEQGRVREARELFISILDKYPNPKAVEARLEHLPEAAKP